MATRPTEEDMGFLGKCGFKKSIHCHDDVEVSYIKDISLRWQIFAHYFGEGLWELRLISGGEIRSASTGSNDAKTLPEIYAELIRRINLASEEMSEVCEILNRETASKRVENVRKQQKQ